MDTSYFEPVEQPRSAGGKWAHLEAEGATMQRVQGGQRGRGRVQVTMMGSGRAGAASPLAEPFPGDRVEVLRQMPDGTGAWQGGFRALSEVVPGQEGGPYEGREVVWVMWERDFPKPNPQGAEWPAEYVRVVDELGSEGEAEVEETQRPPLHSASRPTPPVQPALFYRPDQLRDRAGRWVDEYRRKFIERRAQAAQAKVDAHNVVITEQAQEREKVRQGRTIPTAVLRVSEKEKAKHAKDLAEVGYMGRKYTHEEMVRNILEIYDSMSEEDAWIAAQWYREAYDLSHDWAEHYDTTGEIVALVIAATSPQAGWGDTSCSEIDFMKSNLGQAYQVMELAFTRANEQVELTDADAVALQEQTRDEYQQINLYSYNGRDARAERGRSWVGRHKWGDLPVDVAVAIARRRGILNTSEDQGGRALRMARGYDPDEPAIGSKKGVTAMEGPKIRSFYNNIIAPDVGGDVTLDTHALRLVFRTPLDKPAKAWVGKTKQSTSRYTVVADAYRAAAAERGILPHEMQAATWVQWRKHNSTPGCKAWRT